jgi:2-oxoglutarate ferredoxin oxidoreductase subunit beta
MVTTEGVELKFDAKEYRTDVHPLWCPGCGDFAILKAVKNALFELQLDPSQTILVAGIGCSSKMMHAVGTYGLHTIHGRALPHATGVKLANHNLNVIAFGGDGDMLGIGGNHLVHACRRNADMLLIIPNNQTYGLTTGQASPTSDKGYKTTTSPHGTVEQPVNATQLAITAGASFVARSSTANNEHLQRMIEEGFKHKGMAVIDVLQFCITFNKVNTPDYYEPRLFDVQETDHDTSDYEASLLLSSKWGDKIPYGVIYKHDRGSFEDAYQQLQGKSLVEKRNKVPRDMTKFFEDKH